MTFTINSITRCSGGNHIRVVATVDGKSRTVDLELSDFQTEPTSTSRELFINRLRSAVKEVGANNWTQIQSALVGKDFTI